MNIAIIVAAGTGKRFSTRQPKQFTHLLGKPIILYTLERFEACPSVDEIVLVLSEVGSEEFRKVSEDIHFDKLTRIVEGGETRAASVRNALSVLNASPDDIVAVHDGVRPLVTVDEISRTIEKALETGAACLVTDVTDTIKEVDGTHIVGTVDRHLLRRALTPQAFRFDIVSRAFATADHSESITDECYLVEKLGIDIATVEGGSQNIKITRREDLILAEAMLKNSAPQ
jgi:2-C-methyl-D-erythritol 4-phosphate cytidylyltransferase